VVSTIVNNNNTARISIRKALTYSGCSKNIYYGNKDHRYDITAAVTAATAVTPSLSSTTIEKEIQQISMERPTYGTREEWLQCSQEFLEYLLTERGYTENIQKDGLHYTI
jgi:hypothetical protein